MTDHETSKTDVVSWAWKPRSSFDIDLQIADERLIVTIDASNRVEVAESLARLADAVMGNPRTLIWRWDDGAEWDLTGNTIREAPDEDDDPDADKNGSSHAP